MQPASKLNHLLLPTLLAEKFPDGFVIYFKFVLEFYLKNLRHAPKIIILYLLSGSTTYILSYFLSVL